MNRALLAVRISFAFAVFAHLSTVAEDDTLAPFYQPNKIRALILSGRNNHDWRTTTPFLKQLMLDSGRFDVRVAEATDGLTEQTLAPYDVMIMDYGGPRWGEVTEKAIESLVRAGKGFVTIHGASYHFSGLDVITDGHRPVGRKEPAWPAFRRLVGCGWDAMPAKGYHGPRHTFAVKITQPDHPIVQGMPDSFPATDELYHGMAVTPEATVIATAFSASERGGTGNPEPMLVVSEFGKGRCFYTALGHETPAMWEPGFRSTFLRGVEWAATGKVTLPPDAGWSTQGNDPVRVLVVTGGHDYDPSFYTVFEGAPGIRWRHTGSNQEAFRSDLRASVDVLVLFDLSQDLDATGRRHLQTFVESGKGLVVLHHALADYSSWEWWWKEVVGGRYVLKEEPGFPASTYQHDQWLEITPAVAHPVVGDLGPMRFLDETYRQVWHAPGIQPLLKTSNPTSDEVIAWISPWKKSRVVALQPGHDQQSHRHPAYRRLVLNAILWSAGKRH
ncbi:MAG: ThuA domain-containing protein [Verrucomicrobiales bacterium]|nr:ThuA domain-containing protein [Verrucomicrobiales bacterium]